MNCSTRSSQVEKKTVGWAQLPLTPTPSNIEAPVRPSRCIAQLNPREEARRRPVVASKIAQSVMSHQLGTWEGGIEHLKRWKEIRATCCVRMRSKFLNRHTFRGEADSWLSLIVRQNSLWQKLKSILGQNTIVANRCTDTSIQQILPRVNLTRSVLWRETGLSSRSSLHGKSYWLWFWQLFFAVPCN